MVWPEPKADQLQNWLLSQLEQGLKKLERGSQLKKNSAHKFIDPLRETIFLENLCAC